MNGPTGLPTTPTGQMRPVMGSTNSRGRLSPQQSVFPRSVVMQLRLFRGGGGVVVDDLPAVGEFAEDQGEAAVRSFAGRQGQVPGAADEGRFRAEDFNTKIREIQLPHLVARAGVGGAITIERGLPSAGF